MPQFDLFRNGSNRTYPFLVDLQADLLRDLGTRVVAPLTPIKAGRPIDRLNPVVEIGGRKYAVVFQEMAAAPIAVLKVPVGSLRTRRDDMIAALDFLFTGF